MKFTDKLRLRDRSSAVAFHLEGILDAGKKIESHLDRLEDLEDAKTIPDTLVDLQIEIFSHLFHHMKELRRPLELLIQRSYAEAETENDS